MKPPPVKMRNCQICKITNGKSFYYYFIIYACNMHKNSSDNRLTLSGFVIVICLFS